MNPLKIHGEINEAHIVLTSPSMMFITDSGFIGWG